MLVLVAIVVSGVSLFLNTIGFAIPYWTSFSAAKTTVHIGLWQGCTSLNIISESTVCVTIPDENVNSALKATRALDILGTLVVLGALVCLALKQFVMKDQRLLSIVGGGSAIMAGLLMIIGTIIFATDDALKPEAVDLGSGFALCIVAGILGIVAGALAIVGHFQKE